jgi:nitrite reductase/ring-hydroxylating ferredoxin subunit
MADWHDIGSEDMLADGAMTELQVGDRTLLLARVAAKYYAVDAICPHLGGHLAHGRLNDYTVICPHHRSEFDVRDGRNLSWIPKIPGVARRLAAAVKRPQDLGSYSIRISGGHVQVELA